MIRSLFVYLFAIIYILFSVPFLLIGRRRAKHLDVVESDRLIHRIPSHISRTVLKLSGANIHLEGAEHIPSDGPVLFVSNHQGLFDILLLLGHLKKPVGFVAKKETEKIPVINMWMKAIHCVFLDRKNPRQAVVAFREGISYLKEGHSLVIFPEGTRSSSDQMAPFKSGSFRLAEKAGVPIVPVTIQGTYKMFEQNRYIIRPADIHLVIHPAVHLERGAKVDLNEVKDIVESQVAAGLSHE